MVESIRDVFQGMKRPESDMGVPIRHYLMAQGYTVRSEVKGCDLTATREDTLIIVEMKRHFSADLLIQAIERQAVADAVYVALPQEKKGGRADRYGHGFGVRWRGMEKLLKRLELGLLLVSFPETDAPPTVEIVLHPIMEPKARKRPKKRAAILREIAGRSDDYNVGGSNNRQLLTAYREQAIYIAVCLDRFGPQSPARLRARGAGAKTQDILGDNVYGWFEHLSRGLYAIRPQVREHLGAAWPGVAEGCLLRAEENEASVLSSSSVPSV